MKERLVQLLDLEQLSPSKFADIIGVQRSSVSHVISERNKPSFDFIQKTLKAFPGLNADWLILGQGSIYDQMGRGGSGNLFDPPAESINDSFPEDIPEEERSVDKGVDPGAGKIDDVRQSIDDYTQHKNTGVDQQDPEVAGRVEIPEPDPSKRVVQVMVFYDDDTFKSFKPSL